MRILQFYSIRINTALGRKRRFTQLRLHFFGAAQRSCKFGGSKVELFAAKAGEMAWEFEAVFAADFVERTSGFGKAELYVLGSLTEYPAVGRSVKFFFELTAKGAFFESEEFGKFLDVAHFTIIAHDVDSEV